MPNWTTNHLYLEGTPEAIATVKSFYTEADPNERFSSDCFDFEKIIPMPEALRGIVSPTTIVETQEEADRINEERGKGRAAEDIGQRRALSRTEAHALYSEYGATNWYDWSVRHWGTKWNSNGAEILHSDETRLVVRFDSAWSEPSGIFSHLRSLEGISEVEHVSLHEGGDDPTMSEDWERFFEMDVETYEDEAPDGEVSTYTNTSVSYSPDAEVVTGVGPTV